MSTTFEPRFTMTDDADQPTASPAPPTSTNGNKRRRPAQPRSTDSPTEHNGRNTNGRFAPGNAGGPGNPFGRYAAMLRTSFMKTATPERMEQFAAALMDYAIGGNMAAAKIVAQYTMGKPTDAPDPDRQDLVEWNLFKESAPMLDELKNLMNRPNPDVLLQLLRVLRPVMAEAVGCKLAYLFSMSPKENENLAATLAALSPVEAEMLLSARSREAALKRAAASAPSPSPNGETAQPTPSPNGGVARPESSMGVVASATAPSPNGGASSRKPATPTSQPPVGEPLATHEQRLPAAPSPPPDKRRSHAFIPKAMRKDKKAGRGTGF